MTSNATNSTAAAINEATTAEAPQVLSAWSMAVSILHALDVALARAEAEYAEVTEAAKGVPYGPGVSAAGQLIGTLNHARRALGPDMHQLARANGRII